MLCALDLGATFFDTTALYGFGANEELLGRALMHHRSGFILASKCVLAEIDGKRGLDGSPAAIAPVLEDSLRWLHTDHTDLYYLRRLDPKVPIEESVVAPGARDRSRQDRVIGLSEMSAASMSSRFRVPAVSIIWKRIWRPCPFPYRRMRWRKRMPSSAGTPFPASLCPVRTGAGGHRNLGR
ncbi:aldo/keto reductase [Sphingobium ummariense]|uniref:aldo/keto reductase n=1 Tax=Sphingobium ummariense TaxID=420994 RepID=UPI001F1A31BF|nr:aldo/keto reductase [Sphingobium ummariense]